VGRLVANEDRRFFHFILKQVFHPDQVLFGPSLCDTRCTVGGVGELYQRRSTLFF
jgi:hypothetical protein